MTATSRGLASRPDPLVAITGEVLGEPEALDHLVKALELCFIAAELEKNKLRCIRYKCLSSDYLFPLANSDASKSRRSSLETSIVKQGWMDKHCDERPSLVLMLCTFNVTWNEREWNEYETLVQTRCINIRTNLNGRNTKLLLVAVKTGNEAESVGTEVLLERKSSLTSTLQLDNYNFDMVSIKDFDGRDNGGKSDVPIQMLFRKVFKYSMNYYAMQVKRALGRLEDCISDVMQTYANTPAASNGGDDSVTTFGDPTSPGGGKGVRIRDVTYLGLARARYNYKAAFFCDFQGLSHHSLGYYRKSFQSLVSVAENVDDDLREHTRVLAELSNYRICDYLMRLGDINPPFYSLDGGQDVNKAADVAKARRDAATQFEVLVTSFKGLDTSYDAVMHCAYMCRQYLLYLALVEQADGAGAGAGGEGKGGGDKSELYLQAAKHAIRAREASHSEGSLRSVLSGANSPASDGCRPSEQFFSGLGAGASAVASAGGSDANREDNDLPRELLPLALETGLDHHKLIVQLLERAYTHTPDRHYRRRSHILTLQCDQCAQIGMFEAALIKLDPMLTELCAKRWTHLAVPLLRKKMAWAAFLGRLPEYLDGALRLYSHAMNEGRGVDASAAQGVAGGGGAGAGSHTPGPGLSGALGRYDIEELNRDLLSVISTLGRSATLTPASSAGASNGSGGGEVSLTPSVKGASLPGGGAPSSPLLSPSRFVAVPWRPEFGMSATSPLSYVLPHGHTAVCSALPSSTLPRLFDITVEFDDITRHQLGSVVRVQMHIMSRFYGMLHVAECRVHWSLSVLSQTFRNSEELLPDADKAQDKLGSELAAEAEAEAEAEARDRITSEPMSAPLNFAPGEPVTLDFQMPLTGDALDRLVSASDSSQGALLCVERVEFVMRSAFSVQRPSGVVGAPPGASPDGSPISAVPAAAAEDDDNSSSSSSKGVGLDEGREEEDRDFVFCVRTIPDKVASELRHLQELEMEPSKQTLGFLNDYAATVGGRNLAGSSNLRVLRVARPVAAVQIVTPAPLTATAATASAALPPPPSSSSSSSASTTHTQVVRLHARLVQRTTLRFSPCGEDLSSCRVRLTSSSSGGIPAQESDSTGSGDSETQKQSLDRYLFWWPSQGDTADSAEPESEQYHPLLLDSAGQPSEQLAVVPAASVDQGGEALFEMPLYLRAPPGSTTITITLHLRSGTEKVFLVPVKFTNALDVAFNVMHAGDLWPEVQLQRTLSRSPELLALVGKGPPLPPTRSPGGAPVSPKAPVGEGVNARALSPLKPSRSPGAGLSAGAGVHGQEDLRPVVVLGDTLMVSAELTCLGTSREDGSVEVDSFTMQRPASEAGAREEVPPSLFHFAGEMEGVVNLLSQGGTYDDSCSGGAYSLRAGETLAGAADIVCAAPGTLTEGMGEGAANQTGAKKGQLRLPAVELSFGSVCIRWHAKSDTHSDEVGAGACQLPLWSGREGAPDAVEATRQRFSPWAVNPAVRASGGCVSYFEMPTVTLVEPPFAVRVEEPLACSVGHPVTLTVRVSSSLWTPERLTLNLAKHFHDSTVEPNQQQYPQSPTQQKQPQQAQQQRGKAVLAPEYFLVAGGASQAVHLGPRGSCAVSVSLLPLRCGNAELPRLELTWGRYNSPLLSLARRVYVSPAPSSSTPGQ